MPRPKGQVKKIKNGVWLMRVETNKNGVRKSQSKRYESKDKAEQALKLLLKEIDNIADISQTKTFDQLFDAYLEIIAPKIAEQSYFLYERIIKNHLRPEFGHLYLPELTPYQIESYYARLQKTLSGETIFKIHNQLKAALKKARMWRWIIENPLEFVKSPSRGSRPIIQTRRHEAKDILTPEEIDRFVDACGDLRTQCLWLFFALSGARASEVFAARWKDLDFKNNLFNLEQKLVQTKQVKKFDKPKTDKSQRTFPFPDWFMKMLQKLKIEQNIIRLKSEYWEDNGLVFATAFGKPLRLSNIGEKCYKIAAKAGIKKHITPHSFRHSFISQNLKDGQSVRAVADFVGHSSAKLTLDTYAHSDLEEKRQISESFSRKIKMR